MLEINNQFTFMKRRLETEVIKSFFKGTLIEDVDKIPVVIIPKDRIPNRSTRNGPCSATASWR